MSEISNYLTLFGSLKVLVETKGNFSLTKTPENSWLNKGRVFKNEGEILQELLCQFEKELGLRIVSWQTWNLFQNGTRILINHEPTKKDKVVLPPEPADPDEPDVGL